MPYSYLHSYYSLKLLSELNLLTASWVYVLDFLFSEISLIWTRWQNTLLVTCVWGNRSNGRLERRDLWGTSQTTPDATTRLKKKGNIFFDGKIHHHELVILNFIVIWKLVVNLSHTFYEFPITYNWTVKRICLWLSVNFI